MEGCPGGAARKLLNQDRCSSGPLVVSEHFRAQPKQTSNLRAFVSQPPGKSALELASIESFSEASPTRPVITVPLSVIHGRTPCGIHDASFLSCASPVRLSTALPHEFEHKRVEGGRTGYRTLCEGVHWARIILSSALIAPRVSRTLA